MSSYTLYEKARAEIDARRNAARAEADGRNEIVRAESDEIREIDAELQGTGLLIFKTAVEGGDIAPIRDRNRALQARRKEIIKSLGYPEDYTEVKYTCKKCSDTGSVDGIKLCSCLKEIIVRERIAASAMGKLIEKQSFDNFDLSFYSYDPKVQEKMKMILAMAKNYVRDFSKRRDNLLLIGPTGTGKTHISTAIARELIHQGYDVIYNTVPHWLFGRDFLACADPKTFLIDLASVPGGVDIRAAKELGSNVLWATSLPGKYAPRSAGTLIGSCVDRILREEVGL